VLGSATPSLETLERVREGKYSAVHLDRRIAPGGLPKIELVDLKTEVRIEGTQAPLALKTVQAIQETLAAGEQVMVYLNRRGFAAFLICKDCGKVRECQHCSITLSVYKRDIELRCHLCGHREPTPDQCEKCTGLNLMEMGAGTESLEVDLPRVLEGAKVLRLDRDQITSNTRLTQILESFRRGEANLLLGTQMLVKGHDFPGVTLVVVVMADPLFRWPDFKTPERAFQILKQVSGRAGRGDKPGRVLIQTYDSEHPVLKTLLGELPEEEFYSQERELRQALQYPPFGRLARLRFESTVRDEAYQRAMELTKRLEAASSAEAGVEILGPSEAFLKRVKGVFRWDLLIKAREVGSLQRALFAAKEYSLRNKWPFLADIDPNGV
jgi:primosomal protein N' (replication factor Y) (superfamily II helicase)